MVDETQENVSLSAEELNELFNVGIALSAEQDMDVLLESILVAAKNFCNAEGGTLYLMNVAENQLIFSILHNDKLNIKMGGTSDKKEIPFPPLYLYKPDTNEPNLSNVATYVALKEEIVNIPDAYDSEDFDFSGTKTFDEKSGYRSKSFLTVPLKTRTGQLVAVLQLINARAKFGETVGFSHSMQKLVEHLASHAAVAIDNQQLVSSQRNVLESFLEIIARAIDERSAYMGAHCQQVPVIARMMAMEAVIQQEGPFKDFELSEDDWYSFHLASWLHDCGKVTTPENLIDKATKLETITNRIHEIRTRFEILRRDAHIIYLKKRLLGQESQEKLTQEFNTRVKQLENDFALIAEANKGLTQLSSGQLERIHALSKMTYYRHFDKTLGLSRGEIERIGNDLPPKTNPKEPLLEDRKDHIWGGYNRGELYNLSIPYGTITPEETDKINDHINVTIEMLNKIPFPAHIKNVVEYAAGHHERMDGRGYPNRLKRIDLSIPARILGIADVFEAISSTSQPYKKKKTLSEILSSMSSMAKSGHIDIDLFNLLLTSGIYQEYAEQYMLEEQLEDVNIEDYLIPTD